MYMDYIDTPYLRLGLGRVSAEGTQRLTSMAVHAWPLSSLQRDPYNKPTTTLCTVLLGVFFCLPSSYSPSCRLVFFSSRAQDKNAITFLDSQSMELGIRLLYCTSSLCRSC